MLASRSPVLRSDSPLSDDQIHRVAPSIFAVAPHESRSQRYAYIPTATVLTELRKEGFQPFMVTQTRTRHEDRRDYTKHMIRLRHASQINARGEANEIILLNSHDGTCSYQMLAGMFRFVCSNGLVCGDTVADVRVPHKAARQGHEDPQGRGCRLCHRHGRRPACLAAQAGRGRGLTPGLRNANAVILTGARAASKILRTGTPRRKKHALRAFLFEIRPRSFYR